MKLKHRPYYLRNKIVTPTEFQLIKIHMCIGYNLHADYEAYIICTYLRLKIDPTLLLLVIMSLPSDMFKSEWLLLFISILGVK